MREEITHTEGRNAKASSGRMSLPEFKPERYQPMLEEFELSDEQAQELLSTLWQIMCGFVLFGFGDQSIQKILPSLDEAFSQSNQDGVQSEHSENKHNNKEVSDED